MRQEKDQINIERWFKVRKEKCRWAFVLHFKISIQILYSSNTVESFYVYAKFLIYCQTLHTWLLTDCEIERDNKVIYVTMKLITDQKQMVKDRGTEGQVSY